MSLDMFKCQCHMGNSNIISMGVHLHVQSQNLAIDTSKYNIMSWHVQVSISYGKLQCHSNETSSLSNTLCLSVNFIWQTPMSFPWKFISMYNLKTKLQIAKHIKGHQNLVSILWKRDSRMRHHIGGMGHIKSGTPILQLKAYRGYL